MIDCANCGNAIPDGATFCNQCWRSVGPNEPMAAAPAGVDPGAQAGEPATTVLGEAPPVGAPSFEAPNPAPAGGTGWGAAPSPGDTGSSFGAAPPPLPPSPWQTGPPPQGAAPPWGAEAALPPAGYGYGAPPPPPAYGAPGGYGPGGYGPGGYGAVGGGYYAPPGVGSNGLAIASLVCSLVTPLTCGVSSVAGVVLGHVALSQIKRTGQQGRGLAIGGLAVGYIAIVLGVLLVVISVASSSSGY